MAKIEFYAESWSKAISMLEKEVGPRQYYLHNSCGGKDWKLSLSFPNHKFTLEVNDKTAVWLSLKLNQR